MAEKFAPGLRHRIKRAAFWLIWPAIAVIVWGELTPRPPPEISELLGWSGRRALFLFLVVVALGGVLEILQAFVGRDAEWGDMLANSLGATAGTLVALGLLAAARLVDRRRAE